MVLKKHTDMHMLSMCKTVNWYSQCSNRKCSHSSNRQYCLLVAKSHLFQLCSCYYLFCVNARSCMCALSPPGSIFQILTCLIWALWVHVTYLFVDSGIKSCDSPDWLVHTCYQSASSRVSEAKFLTQKCFSIDYLIIVSLNTVIPINVIV